MASEGLGEPWMACSTRSRRSSYWVTAPSPERFFSNSEISAPAANASVPAPRKAMQRTSGSRSNCSIAGGIARHMSPLMAFFFAGWLNTSQPTAPRFSTVRVKAYGSWSTCRPVDGRDRGARIARRPASGVDLAQEVLEKLIEERRLLQVDGVPALREHGKPGGRNAALHEKVGLQARLFLVADHDERRDGHLLHRLGEVIDRSPSRLHAEQGVRRADSGMLVELRQVLGEAARVLVLQLHALGADTVGGHELRHAVLLNALSIR